MTTRPDWNEIAKEIGDDLSPTELHTAWNLKCRNWLQNIANAYGTNYRIYETANFYILSDESDRYLKLFSSFLERMRVRILETLKGVAADEGFGKHVALVFTDIDQYYEYTSQFYPDDGEFGLSAGVFINEGYGHFAFPSQDISIAEPIAAHELTHACLAHLPIPTWLNEGIAVVMEEVLAGVSPYINSELLLRHRRYWNSDAIQGFWSGDSFHAIDEGQELSYSLAQILVRNISKDYQAFAAFCRAANSDDAGQAAAQQYLGVSLQDLIEPLLGEGDWHPKHTG